MRNENRDRRNDSVFSRKIRAGRRRTYFFDVRSTRGNDYYLTITESKKRFDGNGYERHKIFLYKEDFNKFLEEATAAIDYIKAQMPDFDFDAFSHKNDRDHEDGYERHDDASERNNYDDDHTADTDHDDHSEHMDHSDHMDGSTGSSENTMTNDDTSVHTDDDDLKL